MTQSTIAIKVLLRVMSEVLEIPALRHYECFYVNKDNEEYVMSSMSSILRNPAKKIILLSEVEIIIPDNNKDRITLFLVGNRTVE